LIKYPASGGSTWLTTTATTPEQLAELHRRAASGVVPFLPLLPKVHSRLPLLLKIHHLLADCVELILHVLGLAEYLALISGSRAVDVVDLLPMEDLKNVLHFEPTGGRRKRVRQEYHITAEMMVKILHEKIRMAIYESIYSRIVKHLLIIDQTYNSGDQAINQNYNNLLVLLDGSTSVSHRTNQSFGRSRKNKNLNTESEIPPAKLTQTHLISPN
jgi:hypothetical protein